MADGSEDVSAWMTEVEAAMEETGAAWDTTTIAQAMQCLKGLPNWWANAWIRAIPRSVQTWHAFRSDFEHRFRTLPPEPGKETGSEPEHSLPAPGEAGSDSACPAVDASADVDAAAGDKHSGLHVGPQRRMPPRPRAHPDVDASLCQTGSVEDYVSQFRSASVGWNVSDWQLRDRFYSGLRLRLQRSMPVRTAPNLEHMIAAALAAGTGGPAAYAGGRGGGGTPRFDGYAPRAGRHGDGQPGLRPLRQQQPHHHHLSPLPPPPGMHYHGTTVVPYHIAMPMYCPPGSKSVSYAGSHPASTPPSPQGVLAQQLSAQPSQGTLRLADLMCLQTSPTTEDELWPRRLSVEECPAAMSAPTAIAWVQGWPVACLVASQANSCVIDRDLASTLGLVLEPTRRDVAWKGKTDAPNGALAACVAREVPVTVQGKTWAVSFVIASLGMPLAVLGQPWINAMLAT